MYRICGCRKLLCGLATLVLAVLPAPAADGPALELAQTIKLTGPAGKRLDHLALDAKRNRLYVANSANGSLDVIDLKAGKLLKSIPEQKEIQGVAYAPGVDRVFATLPGGTCNVFDGDSFKLVKALKVPDADNVRHEARGNLLYVSSGKKIAVFDAKSLDAKGEIALPSPAESFIAEKARPRMYVNVPGPRKVLVVDTDKREVQKQQFQMDEAGNYPLALDEEKHRLFVGTRKEPRVFVIDTESGKILSGVPVPNDVDDLFFDAKRKRLYASCGEGYVVVLKQAAADRYEVQEKIATAKMARTCLFDADGSRLFVPIPGDKEGPEVRVYRVKP